MDDDFTGPTDASRSPSTPTGQSGSATTAAGRDARYGKPLDQTHIQSLQARGLNDLDLIVTELGVTSSELLGGSYSIAIPYFDGDEQVGRKHRTLEGTKRFAQDKGSAQIFYNVNCLRDDTLLHLPVIITEGELDCWAVLMSTFPRCVSVPGGAPADQVEDVHGRKYGFVTHAEQWLTRERASVIILAVDNDAQGRNLRHDLIVRFGAARCRHIVYPANCKDLNDVLRIFGPDQVRKCIHEAEPVAIEGWSLYRDIVEPPEYPALTTGIEGMDDHYKPRQGDFCLITGIPGMGKSGFVNELVCRMAANHNWRTVMASFETQVKPDLARELRTFYAAKLQRNMDGDEIAAADEWIDRHISFIRPPLDTDATLLWLLETAEQAVLRFEAQCLVIDPWNEMDHLKSPEMTTTEYTGFAIRKLQALAQKLAVHLIIVAHPAKMQRVRSTGEVPVPNLYDVADSAHWANKPDVAIIIHRFNIHTPNTLIKIAKVRHRAIGRVGELAGIWNRETGCYQMGDRHEILGNDA